MKIKEFYILISLILFDLITKILANHFLPFKEDYYLIKDVVSLFLVYNTDSSGSQLSYFIDNENKNLFIILNSLNILVIIAYFLFIRNKKIKLFFKILIGLFIILINDFLIQYLFTFLSNYSFSNWITSIIGKLTGIIFFGTIFFLSKNKFVRFFTLLILSGGIGNLLNYFYTPFLVIDFIYLEGIYEMIKIGVFNFADLFIDIGSIGLILTIITIIILKIFNFVRLNIVK